MKQCLNTLFVLTQHAYLSKESEAVTVRVGEDLRLRVPVLSLSSIVCFGSVSISPHLMSFCSERGVGIAFLTEHGRFLARVEGPTHGNVLLRRAQYRLADDDGACRDLVAAIVSAKLANSRGVLLRASRDHPEADADGRLSAAAISVASGLRGIEDAQTVDSLRGIEGAAAAAYFDVFDRLLVQQKEDFTFSERSRRPPLDRVNALLSFVYTLLLHDVRSALEATGLDPQVGFLHKERPGRPSLALDLLEELRSWFADRLVLSLVNLRQLTPSHFQVAETKAVTLTDEGRKILLSAFQRRKQEETLHPFLEERMPVGLVPHVQAQLLARRIRGDLDAYPAFFART